MNKINPNKIVYVNTAEIGRRIGISQQYVHMILSGQRTGYKHRKKIEKMIKRGIDHLISLKSDA